MNCENIQEIILVDYLDEQMSSEKRDEVDRHLSSCAACREFAATARKMTVEPFAHAQKAGLSRETIWQDLKERIESEAVPVASESFLPGLWEILKHAFRLPKPVFALATVAVLFFAAAVLMVPDRTGLYVQADRLQDEMQSIAYVADEILLDVDDMNSGYDTAIEEYFL